MCNCIEEVNEQLKPHNTELGVSIFFTPPYGRVEVVTFIPLFAPRKRGQKPKRMVATYCPFCGKKYEDES